MTTRGVLKTLVRTYLGTISTDPQYSDAILEPLLQDATNSLIIDMLEANPDCLSAAVTLAADSSTSHTYTLGTQSVPVTDFARWLEVRWTDADGSELIECRREELASQGADRFCVLSDGNYNWVLRTSPDSEAGTALYVVYAQQPADMAGDAYLPGGVPIQFHDVVALEAASVAYGFGGEQQMPRELFTRWRDRRAQLMSFVGRRGTQPSRTRLYNNGTD